MRLQNDTTFNFKKWEKNCYDLVVELHTMGAVSDELLLHTTRMKWNDNSCRKRQRCITNSIFVAVNQHTAYAYPLFKTRKLNPDG